MRILIVEGNTADIISKRRSIKQPTAADLYRSALNRLAPDCQLDIAVPYAPELEEKHIDLASYDAFALSGSGVDWSSSDPEARAYLDYLERIFGCSKPVIGSCWGMQTVAQLFGGHSEPNKNGFEVGSAKALTLSQQGQQHWIYEGMPAVHDSICIHRDHVTRMPEGFAVLASNVASHVQAMVSTRSDVDFTGFQYHPEYTWAFIHWQAIYLGHDKLDPIRNHVHLPQNPSLEVSDPEIRMRPIANWLNHVCNKKAAAMITAA